MDNTIFNDILDDGEKIVAVMRPNRRKFWAFFNWIYFWATASWIIPTAAMLVLIWCFADEPEITANLALANWLTIGISAACLILPYAIAVPFGMTTLAKRYYAYSNKRILIRCGIIGVDYKVLDYKLLGATTVTVGVLDRMMGGKTGYIRFGSASSPIITSLSSGMLSGGFTFAHVDSPYALLKEIKRIIDGSQK
jgi:hypothetical protein